MPDRPPQHPIPNSGLGVVVQHFDGAPANLPLQLQANCVKIARAGIWAGEGSSIWQPRTQDFITKCTKRGITPYVSVSIHNPNVQAQVDDLLNAVEWVHNQGVQVGVLNEPNASDHFLGTISDAADLYLAARNRIGVSPYGPHLASCDPSQPDAPCTMTLQNWLRDWLQLIAPHYPPVVTVHFYGDWISQGTHLNNVWWAINSAGAGNPDIWYTEHGTANPNNDQTIRAQHLAACLEIIEGKGTVKAIMPYRAWDPPGEPHQWEILSALGEVYCPRFS